LTDIQIGINFSVIGTSSGPELTDTGQVLIADIKRINSFCTSHLLPLVLWLLPLWYRMAATETYTFHIWNRKKSRKGEEVTTLPFPKKSHLRDFLSLFHQGYVLRQESSKTRKLILAKSWLYLSKKKGIIAFEKQPTLFITGILKNFS
jgi:hypothetical protein